MSIKTKNQFAKTTIAKNRLKDLTSPTFSTRTVGNHSKNEHGDESSNEDDDDDSMPPITKNIVENIIINRSKPKGVTKNMKSRGMQTDSEMFF